MSFTIQMLENPSLERSMEFLASLDVSVSNKYIGGLPGKTNVEKKKIVDSVASMRKDYEKNNPKFLAAVKIAFDPLDLTKLSYNIWSITELYNSLFKTWLLIARDHKIALPAGHEPYLSANVLHAHYILQKLMQERLKIDLKYPAEFPPNSELPVPIRCWENIGWELTKEVCTFLLGRYKERNFVKIGDVEKEFIKEYLKAKLLTIIEFGEYFVVKYSDPNTAYEVEREFIKKWKRYSAEFADTVREMKESLKEGEELPWKIARLERLLSTGEWVEEVEDDIPGEEAKGEGRPGKKGDKLSIFSSILEKIARSNLRDQDTEIEVIPPVTPVYPRFNLKKFERAQVTELDLTDNEKLVLDLPTPHKLMPTGDPEKIRILRADRISVYYFMKDNKLDLSDRNDLIYGCIMARLVASGAILPSDPRETPAIGQQPSSEDTPSGSIPEEPAPGAAEISTFLTESVYSAYTLYAKTMMDASFYFASQGAVDGSVRWYESFCEVHGKIVAEKRFISICNKIMASGFLKKYVMKTTVGDVENSSKVFKYRLSRVSSPGLIFRALSMVDNDFVSRMVDATALGDYWLFLRAGILAQIAAGPLEVLLSGPYNPLEYDEIPNDVKIGHLQPIPDAPYNERLLKQAKIIFETYNVDVGKWYQGEKAMNSYDLNDNYFREVIRALKNNQADSLRNVSNVLASGMPVVDFGDDANIGPVKGFLKTYAASKNVLERES